MTLDVSFHKSEPYYSVGDSSVLNERIRLAESGIESEFFELEEISEKFEKQPKCEAPSNLVNESEPVKRFEAQIKSPVQTPPTEESS